MARIRTGVTVRDNKVAFVLELDAAIAASEIGNVERRVMEVRVPSAARLMPLAFRLTEDARIVAFYSGSLTNHELKQALRILMARLHIYGYAKPTPKIPDPPRSV